MEPARSAHSAAPTEATFRVGGGRTKGWSKVLHQTAAPATRDSLTLTYSTNFYCSIKIYFIEEKKRAKFIPSLMEKSGCLFLGLDLLEKTGGCGGPLGMWGPQWWGPTVGATFTSGDWQVWGPPSLAPPPPRSRAASEDGTGPLPLESWWWVVVMGVNNTVR